MLVNTSETFRVSAARGSDFTLKLRADLSPGNARSSTRSRCAGTRLRFGLRPGRGLLRSLNYLGCLGFFRRFGRLGAALGRGLGRVRLARGDWVYQGFRLPTCLFGRLPLTLDTFSLRFGLAIGFRLGDPLRF